MFEFYYLDNGVRVLLVPIANVASVAMGVYVRAGTRDENKSNNGVAHFLEHMVFKGSKNYPTPESLMVLESTGGYKNAGTAQEYTMFEAKLPSDKFSLGLDILADIVISPNLKQTDIEKEKQTILEEIKRRHDQSEELVMEEFFHLRFQDEGLKLTTLGTPESILSLSKDQFDIFHQSNYLSAKMLICITGKFNHKSTNKQINKLFNHLPHGDPEKWLPPQIATGPLVKIIEKPEEKQVQLTLGGEAFAMTDSRRFALAILFRILDFGLSGRLFKAIRIDRNLAYSINAGTDLDSDHGSWLVTAGVSKNNLGEIIQVILKELKSLKELGVSKQELADAKEKVRVPLLFSLESPLSQMEFYAAQGLFRPQEILTHEQAIAKVQAVTAQDIQNLARELFVTDNLNLVMVGPVKEAEESQLLPLLEV